MNQIAPETPMSVVNPGGKEVEGEEGEEVKEKDGTGRDSRQQEESQGPLDSQPGGLSLGMSRKENTWSVLKRIKKDGQIGMKMLGKESREKKKVVAKKKTNTKEKAKTIKRMRKKMRD